MEFKPDNDTAWYNRGIALRNLGRNDDAIASYDKVLEFKPDNDTAWYNRGIALEKLGRNDDAIASYDKVLEFKPDNDTAWYNRGIALRNLGRNDDASNNQQTTTNKQQPILCEAAYNALRLKPEATQTKPVLSTTRSANTG